MPEVISYRGEAPALPRREMDVLLQATDADRHLTVLYYPRFFEAAGRKLVARSAGRAIPLLNWLATGHGLPTLGRAATDRTKPKLAAPDYPAAPEGAAGVDAPVAPDAAPTPKAVAFSAHFGESFFWELRFYNQEATAAGDAPAAALARRVKEIPDLFDDYLINAALSTYGRKMLLRDFPPMVKFTTRHTRAAAGEKQLVLRGYLPQRAVQNVALGTYLCLQEGPGAAPPTVVDQAYEHRKPQTASEALEYRISFSAVREAPDAVIHKVSEQIGIPIVINDSDLQLEGITKGISVAMDERDVTVDELLRSLFRKTNPYGKLVYQVKSVERGGPDVIVVTTREAVKKRNEKLLPVFETERYTKYTTAQVLDSLQDKISFPPFERDALDRVLARLSRQIQVPIEIIGADLQLEGITKNQSFGWNEPPMTVDETLRTIFRKAEPDGKLVYIVKTKPTGGQAIIWVSTWPSARKRGEPVPLILERLRIKE
jgi:hypothetical protein